MQNLDKIFSRSWCQMKADLVHIKIFEHFSNKSNLNISLMRFITNDKKLLT